MLKLYSFEEGNFFVGFKLCREESGYVAMAITAIDSATIIVISYLAFWYLLQYVHEIFLLKLQAFEEGNYFQDSSYKPIDSHGDYCTTIKGIVWDHYHTNTYSSMRLE